MLPLHPNLAYDYARTRLERELAPDLSYHSLDHTARRVVPAAERLAAMAACTEEEQTLLCTAAWFHDLGFVERYAGHELVSVRVAVEVLPIFGYAPQHIERIIGMILATGLPQLPSNQLEAILADADLESLGAADFIATSLSLQRELAAHGVGISLEVWYERQHRFLQSHRYHTSFAHALWGQQKQQNVLLLSKNLHQEEPVSHTHFTNLR